MDNVMKKGLTEKGFSEESFFENRTEVNRTLDKKTMEEMELESIFPASSNDQPSDEDCLGFSPYVRAIAEFLTNESTKPPLVLSIEGEWGSGKSSFMLQLKKALVEVEKNKSLREQKDNRNIKACVKRWFIPWKTLTVWFNAWRHEQEEALWAAFALQFLKQVSSQRNWFRRQSGNFLLFWRRFKLKDGWWDLLQKILLSFLAISVVIIIPVWVIIDPQNLINHLLQVAKELFDQNALQNIFVKGIQFGGIITYIVFLIAFWKKLKEFFENPLQIDLKQYLRTPNYENRVTFIEQFHEDFKHILNSYARNQKVYVFIDDLDRCDVPKSADLMKSLSLMISNDPRLVFIIGMDREKVAAGLAVKHEKILNYLYKPLFTATDTDGGVTTRLCGLEYGFDFIEKFVQLPFSVPIPTSIDLNRYLISLTGKTTEMEGGIEAGWKIKLLDRFFLKKGITQSMKFIVPNIEQRAEHERVVENSLKAKRETIKVQVSNDYFTIEKVLRLVVPALERNPRRIKQFINLFRLRVYIATETGLFDISEDSNEAALTLEQLAKFVAIQLRWPLLLVDLERYPKLIEELQLMALFVEKSSDIKVVKEVVRWSSRNDLMALLREGCVDEGRRIDDEKRRMVSLEHVNFEKLLWVSPKIRDIKSLHEQQKETEGIQQSAKIETNDSKAGAFEMKNSKKNFITKDSFSEDKSFYSTFFIEEVIKRLRHLMEVEKVYRDENLSLRNLADRMSIPYYQLSQILNDELKRSFPDFVNHYRIEEAKEILKGPEDKMPKIAALAHEVGFNSLTAFYKAFKKQTGMTPYEYKKVMPTA